MAKRHEAVPLPHKGVGAWGVKDNKTGEVRDQGASKSDAEKLARGWNKNQGKR